MNGFETSAPQMCNYLYAFIGEVNISVGLEYPHQIATQGNGLPSVGLIPMRRYRYLS